MISDYDVRMSINFTEPVDTSMNRDELSSSSVEVINSTVTIHIGE